MSSTELDELLEILHQYDEYHRGIRTDHLIGSSKEETVQALLKWHDTKASSNSRSYTIHQCSRCAARKRVRNG